MRDEGAPRRRQVSRRDLGKAAAAAVVIAASAPPSGAAPAEAAAEARVAALEAVLGRGVPPALRGTVRDALREHDEAWRQNRDSCPLSDGAEPSFAFLPVSLGERARVGR